MYSIVFAHLGKNHPKNFNYFQNALFSFYLVFIKHIRLVFWVFLIKRLNKTTFICFIINLTTSLSKGKAQGGLPLNLKVPNFLHKVLILFQDWNKGTPPSVLPITRLTRKVQNFELGGGFLKTRPCKADVGIRPNFTLFTRHMG